MTKVNYHVLPQSIALNFDGKTFSVHKEDIRHKKILEAIKENNLEAIPALIDPARAFDGTPFQLVEGSVTIPGEGVLPDSLGQRIIDLQRDGLPFTSLINFWNKLKLNPSFNSRLMLYKFLEHNGHPLTEDGNFIAYRSVREDFKDKHTGTMDNSIGNVVEMPRETVDDNPNNTCSSGLHVAAYDYAKGFAETLLEVEIDPKDVVAVPHDYNGQKMRVCKFKVVALCEQLRLESVYGQPTRQGDMEEIEEVDSNEAKLEDLEAELADVQYEIEAFDLDSGDVQELIRLRDERMNLENDIENVKNS